MLCDILITIRDAGSVILMWIMIFVIAGLASGAF